MASLLVRGVEDFLVQALRERAARHGRSAEAEHREIPAMALRQPKRRSFAEALIVIPDVGEERDFTRVNDGGEAPHVFDWHQCRQRTYVGGKTPMTALLRFFAKPSKREALCTCPR